MTRPITAPYGSWKSPITTELMTSQTIGLGQLTIDGKDIYWLESRPWEGGRNALMRLTPGFPAEECLPAEFNVRTRVHEYGGGAFAVFDEVIYFVNFKDQHLYRRKPGGFIELVTPGDGLRYADFALDRPRQRLICVREDHTGAGEAVNTIVAIPLEGGGDGKVLLEGYNFYSNPRLSPDGSRLAWLCWNHPNMPWDGCELWTAVFDPDGSLTGMDMAAGGRDESIFQPEWSPQGMLHFVSDRSGWWNLYRAGKQGIEPLCPMQAEFGVPQWAFGQSTYGFLSGKEIVCTYMQDGVEKLARLDLDAKSLKPVNLPYTEFFQVHTGEGFYVVEAGSAMLPVAILKLDLGSGQIDLQRRALELDLDPVNVQVEILRCAFEPMIAPGYFSLPQAVEFPTGNGLTAHGIFYPPANQDYVAPSGELPPLMVISHGGPTGSTSTSLRYGIQYWTSRGFAILDVNYGGSTGYGREYRMRLNGNWGIVDVDDCCNGARWLADQGLVDARRMTIRGGSAGGFTTLAALVFKDVFSAGASHYGVSDLEGLATDTHKFESRYLDNLVGPLPERRDLYLARSPIHHLDRLSIPLILFQGDEDKVVPPAQSLKMYTAIREKGVPVAYLLFPGEQHGFRRAENIRRSYEAEYYFYSRIFGFTPAEHVEPVRIDNLD